MPGADAGHVPLALELVTRDTLAVLRSRAVPVLLLALAPGACSLGALEGYTNGSSGTVSEPPTHEAGADDGGTAAVDGSNLDARTADVGSVDAGRPDADAGPTYASLVLADHPVAYYPLEDETDAFAAADVVGQHPAKSQGSKRGFGAVGAVGRGWSSDGSTTPLDLGDNFDFAGTQSFTLEAWVKPAFDGQDMHVFHKRHEAGEPFLGYIVYLGNDGSAQFQNWGTAMSSWSDGPLPASAWVHLALVVTWTGAKGASWLYVDGARQRAGGFETTDPTANTPQALRFGSYYRGSLDEIAIYDYALPDDRIVAHRRFVK